MITIIGAGPVGCHAAILLAKAGKEVQVLEEHSEIGKPVQCTGIVTQSIEDVVRLRKEFLVNRLRKARIYAPSGNSVEIRINDIIIDRTKFDSFLAEQAKENGAKILTNRMVESVWKGDDGKIALSIKENGVRKRNEKTDIIIGADGPNSVVSRFIGNKKPEFWIGVQAVMKMPVEKDTYSVYFGDNFPGFFGWVVPEDEETARVGVASAHNPKNVFDRFVKRFDNARVLEMQGGLIPKYNSSIMVQKDNAYIVGDAAAQVKATTGGGLVPGLSAAECLARAIDTGGKYCKELGKVRRELMTSLMIRNILDRFDDRDYDRLIQLIGKDDLKKILNKEDRDRPSRLIFKSIISEPRLLLFSRLLLRAKRL